MLTPTSYCLENCLPHHMHCWKAWPQTLLTHPSLSYHAPSVSFATTVVISIQCLWLFFFQCESSSPTLWQCELDNTIGWFFSILLWAGVHDYVLHPSGQCHWLHSPSSVSMFLFLNTGSKGPSLVVISMVCIQSIASWFEMVFLSIMVCDDECIIIIADISVTIVFLDCVEWQNIGCHPWVKPRWFQKWSKHTHHVSLVHTCIRP